MERNECKAAIEAILFLKEEPVRADRLAAVLEITTAEAEELLAEMQQEFAAQGRGLRIFEIAGGFQMGSAPELAPCLEKAFGEGEPGSLSPAALETLAIIVYKQPLTRIEIEAVRGVRCEHILDILLKRKLIRISGRKEGPGRPLIYKTTPDFLKYFGLKDLAELPPLDREARDLVEPPDGEAPDLEVLNGEAPDLVEPPDGEAPDLEALNGEVPDPEATNPEDPPGREAHS